MPRPSVALSDSIKDRYRNDLPKDIFTLNETDLERIFELKESFIKITEPKLNDRSYQSKQLIYNSIKNFSKLNDDGIAKRKYMYEILKACSKHKFVINAEGQTKQFKNLPKEHNPFFIHPFANKSVINLWCSLQPIDVFHPDIIRIAAEIFLASSSTVSPTLKDYGKQSALFGLKAAKRYDKGFKKIIDGFRP